MRCAFLTMESTEGWSIDVGDDPEGFTRVLEEIDCSRAILVKPTPLYAHADFVRDQNGKYLLMELEMIEPSMYLRTHDKAPQHFAQALNRYVLASMNL